MPQSRRKPTPIEGLKADPQEVFGHATYYHSTKTFLTVAIKNPTIPELDRKSFLYPQVTVCAFACEVYLKCIYAIEHDGQLLDGHHLKDLFDTLSEQNKKFIEMGWSNMAAHNPGFKTTEEMRPGKYKHDLISCLEEGARAFETYRYAYEGKQLQGWALGNLPEVLRGVILHLKPEWKRKLHPSLKSLHLHTT